MAGGKASARQKMINLMYLVFIAMIAMNMSKEVLSAFGLMEAKFDDSNKVASDMNAKLLANLETKGEEKPAEFALAATKAKEISIASESFYQYLEELKKNLIKEGKYQVDPKTGKLPFEQMDKTDLLDEQWFTGDRLSKKGQAVVDRIEAYKSKIKSIIGNDVKYTAAIESFDKRFYTGKEENKDGKKINWLDYHFKGFPAIASYTKLTAMQNDVKVTEANMFNVFLGNTLDEAVSLKNYQAIVLADKSAFFAGQKFEGKVVLGKYANVTPTALKVGSQEINLENAIDSTGAARLDFNVGNVGEHEINGKFTFLEDGKPLEIPIKGNYVVVPRPNSATISADKMNVVYRGVDNPMTISFAGVSDNKVTASAAGLTKKGNGKYVMRPTTGKNITINVTAKLDDGSTSSDKKTFRIKEIPAPTGMVRGVSGSTKMSKSGVEKATVSAELEDFDFDLPLTVTQFDFKVPGQPTITVKGRKLDSRAKGALRRAKRGQNVQFLNIKAKSSGPRIKRVSPVIIEITN